MQFNSYLKLCREEEQLTQDQLVQQLYSYDTESFESLDTSALSKWERGVTQPKIAKQARILNYFQEKTGLALPYLNVSSTEEAQSLICHAGMKNIVGTNKTYISNFPSAMLEVDEIKVYPIRDFDRMQTLLDINLELHQGFNPPYSQVSLEQFKAWSMHPSNLFLACEYKKSFLGLLFTLRLKPDIYHKIINFEMKKSEIKEEDFADFNEDACHLVLSFYALNQKTASLLFVRYYAHLIANQKHILHIGGISPTQDAYKLAKNMNLQYQNKKVLEDDNTLRSYTQTLSHVLASEDVLKMILAKQGCPEEI